MASSGNSKPDPGTFTRRPGVSTTDGEMYEVKTSALFYLKGLNSRRPFQLASNVDGVGAYDDIICRFLKLGGDRNNKDHWTTYLFQLKHKLKDEITPIALTKGKDFGLVKYHKSFLETRDTMLAGDRGDILNGSFQNCHFVIFTNAPAAEKLKNLDGITDESANVDDVVRFGGTEYIFGLRGCHDIVSCLEGKDLFDEFLKKQKMFSGEPRVENMNVLISEEILKLHRFNHSQVTRITEILVDTFQEWGLNSNKILDENSDILNRAISKHKIEILQTTQYERLTLDVTFTDHSLVSLKESLEKQYSILHVITPEHSIEVSCSKLLQALKPRGKSLILTSLECFLAEKESFLSVWETLLVIVADVSPRHSEGLDVIDNLWNALEKDTTKRLVFISSLDNKFVARLKSHPRARFETERDSFDLGQLTLESLEDKLSTKVKFQGREVEKRDLVGNWRNGFQERTSLISSFVVKNVNEPIGQALPDETLDFFIPRTLERRNFIKKTIFKSHSLNCKIAISGITESELQTLVPYNDKKLYDINTSRRIGMKEGERQKLDPDDEMRLSEINNSCRRGVKSTMDSKFLVLCSNNEDEHFKQLCGSHGNVHWLHMECDQLTWKRSHGSVGDILEYIDEDQSSKYKLTTILDLEERIVLLVANPGMGKSTLFTHLAQQKWKSSLVWVVFVHLFEHLDTLESSCTGFKASEFFHSLDASTKAPSIKSLFEQNVLNGTVMVILDGYDELPESCLKNCKLFINYLCTTLVKKIVVTSRPSRGDTLENHLSTIAFSLKLFTPDDQKVFLKKYWRDVDTTLSESQQEDLIDKILKLVNFSISDKERQFTGIPLQTKMVADIFKENYANKNKNEIPQKINVLVIYEMFIEEKHRLVFEKIGFPIDKKWKSQFKKHCQDSDKEHMAAALVVLLDSVSLSNLHDKNVRKMCENFISNLKSGEEKTGIVVREVNGIPIFIHKIFTEFYGGIWMYDYYQQNEIFLRTHFYREEFRVSRNIFDRKLSRDLPLHTAVLNGNTSLVETLLESGNDVHMEDLGGRTALHLAAAVGFRDSSESRVNLTIVETLLKYGGEVGRCDSGVLKWSPLRYADETRAYDVIDLLLKTGKTDHNDMKFTKYMVNDQLQLNELINHSFLQLMDFLLNNGLDPNANLNDITETTLLHKAAECPDEKITNLLIKRGANIMSLDNVNNTPLHWAALYSNLSVVQLLLENISGDQDTIKQYVNARNEHQATAMHCAAQEGHVDIMRLLVSVGGDLEARGVMGRTLLHWAALSGHLSLAQFLLESISGDHDTITQYVNARDTDQATAMHCAAQEGHVDIVLLFVSVGGDLEARGFMGRTSLHWAALSGHLSVAQFLLENISGDRDTITQYVNARDNNQITAMHLAAGKGHVDILQLLLSADGDVMACTSLNSTTLKLAAEYGHVLVVNLILDTLRAADIPFIDFLDIRDNDGDSAVFCAAHNGHFEIVNTLINNGADVSLPDKEGKTSLHIAALNGHLSVVEVLINSFVSNSDQDTITQYVNAPDTDQNTAMHCAAQEGHVDIMRLLVSVGGELEARGFKGRTHLHAAALKGHLSVAQFLLENISDDQEIITQYVDVRDTDQATAMHCAAQKGHVNIMHLLVSIGGDLEACGLQGHTPLHEAALKGHLPVAKCLLEDISGDQAAITQYVNARTINKDTAMHYAAQEGHVDIVRLLVSAGGDLEGRGFLGRTPLHAAALNGHLSVAQFLLENISDDQEIITQYVDVCDTDQATAMHYAAQEGHVNIMHLLVSIGGDLEARGLQGRTPLHAAALKGHQTVAQFLLENISGDQDTITQYVNVRGTDQATAMHCAAQGGHVDIMRLLVSAGGDLEARGIVGSTLLHAAAFCGHLSVAQFLMENISGDQDTITQYVNARNTYQDTVMHNAAQEGHVDIMCLLVSVGGDIEARGFEGRTPLHAAALKGHLSVALFLLKKISGDQDTIPRYVNARNIDQDTAMHCAAQGGHVYMVCLLVSAGGDLEARGFLGRTPLHAAALSGHLSVAQFLLENISGDQDKITQYVNVRDTEQDTAMHYAAQKGHVDIMRLLVSVGGDLTARGLQGRTPLHGVACNGHLFVAQFLLENISGDQDKITQYVNVRDTDQATAMHWAAQEGHVDIMRLLVRAGGDLEACDFEGRTPLHAPASRGHLSVAQFLLENISGDENTITQYVNVHDTAQDTAMHYAAQEGHVDIMRLLVSVGGDLEARDSKGHTPLHAAAFSGHLSVAQFLSENISSDQDTFTQFVNSRDTQDNTAMHFAAIKGRVDILQLLLSAGGDVMACTSHNSTTLNMAAEHGHVLVVNLILDTLRAADIPFVDFLDIRDNDGDSAVSGAAKNGHLEILKTLINNGADVSLPNKEGKTSLHVAALNGHLSVVEVLINSFVGNSEARAAFLDARDNLGQSALTCAELSGHSDIAALLVASRF